MAMPSARTFKDYKQIDHSYPRNAHVDFLLPLMSTKLITFAQLSGNLSYSEEFRPLSLTQKPSENRALKM